jgi:hypothetical protein
VLTVVAPRFGHGRLREPPTRTRPSSRARARARIRQHRVRRIPLAQLVFGHPALALAVVYNRLALLVPLEATAKPAPPVTGVAALAVLVR